MFTNFVDDFHEADEIYGFTNDDLQLVLDASDIEILTDLMVDESIPSGQILTTTSSSSIPTSAIAEIPSKTTAISHTTAASASKDTVSNTAVINSSTPPILNLIQQQIQQHELLTHLKIVNKKLGLL